MMVPPQSKFHSEVRRARSPLGLSSRSVPSAIRDGPRRPPRNNDRYQEYRPRVREEAPVEFRRNPPPRRFDPPQGIRNLVEKPSWSPRFQKAPPPPRRFNGNDERKRPEPEPYVRRLNHRPPSPIYAPANSHSSPSTNRRPPEYRLERENYGRPRRDFASARDRSLQERGDIPYRNGRQAPHYEDPIAVRGGRRGGGGGVVVRDNWRGDRVYNPPEVRLRSSFDRPKPRYDSPSPRHERPFRGPLGGRGRSALQSSSYRPNRVNDRSFRPAPVQRNTRR